MNRGEVTGDLAGTYLINWDTEKENVYIYAIRIRGIGRFLQKSAHTPNGKTN
jgi:hypothetical protein